MAISARMQTTRLKSAVHPKILSSSKWHNENWWKPSFDIKKMLKNIVWAVQLKETKESLVLQQAAEHANI